MVRSQINLWFGTVLLVLWLLQICWATHPGSVGCSSGTPGAYGEVGLLDESPNYIN